MGMQAESPRGLPGLRGVEHIGFTVPDLEQATLFFTDVIGCQYVYSLGPIADEQGDWMTRHLNVPARVRVKELRFFRCGFGPNFEIFEFEGDALAVDEVGQRRDRPGGQARTILPLSMASRTS